MESALNPREIQDKIRSGATVAEVASEAGTPEEWVMLFASPVLAERSHIVTLALSSTIRIREDISNYSLRQVATEKLQSRGLDIDDVSWDSYRLPDRRWLVTGSYNKNNQVRDANFIFDLRNRFSIIDNDDAQWMVSDPKPKTPAPLQDEITVELNDELILLKETTKISDADSQNSISEPALDDLELVDYSEIDSSETNSLYDIMGPKQTHMDVLYDMLSGISEDSVRIYSGLTSPIAGPDINEIVDGENESSQIPNKSETKSSKPLKPKAKEDTSKSESEQEPLIETEDSVTKDQTTPKKNRKSRRASVPSWDEIMFGTPKKPNS